MNAGPRVLLVAFPLSPVSHDAVGGAEQVLSHLDRHLCARGCAVGVVAMEGSRTSGVLMPTPVPAGVLSEEGKAQVQARHLENVMTAIRALRPDLIHMHGLDFLSYLPPPGLPVLVTLHLPPSWYPESVFRLTRPRTWIQCVSRTQQAACPDGSRNLLAPVTNGIPLHRFTSGTDRGDYAVLLGRICPEKNLHEALAAAVRADVSVYLCGQVFPYEAHVRYFHERIEPLLDDRRRFLGPLTLAAKRALLSNARCLLLPSRAPETSSLAAMEALASGAPVIAYRSGAFPEIVEHGVTGFLVDDPEEMAEAIRESRSLDPAVCRATAEERFSDTRMVSEYLERYREILEPELRS